MHGVEATKSATCQLKELTANSTCLVKKFEPLQAGGSTLKLTEKQFEIKCSSIRVRDVQLALCKPCMSSAGANSLPRSTRLSASQKKQVQETHLLQPSTKQEVLANLQYVD